MDKAERWRGWFRLQVLFQARFGIEYLSDRVCSWIDTAAQQAKCKFIGVHWRLAPCFWAMQNNAASFIHLGWE